MLKHKRYADEKLRMSELRYRRLFEAAQDGLLVLDAQSGEITDVNPFLCELLGHSKTELLGKKIWESGVFKDILDSQKAFQELQLHGYIRYNDLLLQTKSGTCIEVEFISNTYLVGEESVIQCNIRDITDRRQAEESVRNRTVVLENLTASQEETKKAMLNVMEDLEAAKGVIEIEKVKDEAILASIGEGLIAIDTNCKVMIINTAAEKMLGFERQDLIGRDITNLTLEDEEGRLLPLPRRPTYLALTTGKTINVNYYFVRKDKTRLPTAIHVTPITLEGKIIGALEIFRDITRETEIDKAKSEFVSLASHQLRTPLGIIKWYLEALEGEDFVKKAPATVKNYFKEIYKSNERVLSLVRDLLSVSRIDQGRIKDSPEQVDPLHMVAEIVEQMQIVARNKKVDLRVTMPLKPMPSMALDVLRFHEVLQNLIGNALEYTLAGGAVEVRVKHVGDMLLISVHDTGIGISPADQKKIFTKFFRSEKAIRHNPEGSGLGLYVVKAYVEGWGGTIAAESVEGKGSTFIISLPVSMEGEDMKGGEEK